MVFEFPDRFPRESPPGIPRLCRPFTSGLFLARIYIFTKGPRSQKVSKGSPLQACRGVAGVLRLGAFSTDLLIEEDSEFPEGFPRESSPGMPRRCRPFTSRLFAYKLHIGEGSEFPEGFLRESPAGMPRRCRPFTFEPFNKNTNLHIGESSEFPQRLPKEVPSRHAKAGPVV